MNHGRPHLRALTLAAAVVAAGCQDVPARYAPGFRRENVSRVTIGTTRTELVSLLGEPLSQPTGPSPAPFLSELYAVPGERWFLGEVARLNAHGDKCEFWMKDGTVESATFFNDSTGRLCTCEKGACPADWAQPCI